MPDQISSHSDKISLDLTDAEQRLIVRHLYIHDHHLLRPICDARPNQPFSMPLDDVEDLCVYLERELQRVYFKTLEPAIRGLLERLRKIVDDHTDKLDTPSTPASASTQPTFPIKYSQVQRRVIADYVPELAGRLQLDERNVRVIHVTIAEMRVIKRLARRAVCAVDNGKIRHSLGKVIAATCEALEKFEEDSILRIRPAERLYQFRISVIGIEPEIWRRIQVRECTLDRLHELIQMALGWLNCHLHRFRIHDVPYGDPCLLDDPVEPIEFEDSTQIWLRDIVPRSGQRLRFEYQYDFGDSWEHEIVYEGSLQAKKGQRYPVCLEGERACPPEDVGGVDGYYEYLEALADPEHEEHKGYLAWRGRYDPEAFDAEKTTKKMHRGMPKPQDDEDWTLWD